jgi:3,4-dihydroxyphenylacetate 2,3-dioxygenase
LDYGVVNALKYLTPNGEIPVVPASVCLASNLDESAKFGEAIRAAILAGKKRVAVISSAAFAHNLVRGPEKWPTPEEQAIDRHMIDILLQGQIATAKSLLPSFAARAKYEMGGRQLATLLGALGGDDCTGELYGYGPSSGSGNPVILFKPNRKSLKSAAA